MNPSIEQISAFIAVYENGSFALAARKEKKHASTLSKRISNLELDLGFELFERHASFLTPNQKAEELYQHAKAIEFEIEQFNYRTLSVLQELPTKITIAIDSSILGLQFTTAITQVSRQYPALDLVFIEGDTSECIEKARSGEVDIAIVLSVELYGMDFAQLKLKSFPFATVASPEYAAMFDITTGAEITQQVRRQMRQITLRSISSMGHSKLQTASHHCYQVNSLPCALDLIRNGLGWGNLPRKHCEHLFESGELIEFGVEKEGQYRWSADAIWQASNPLSEPLKLLIDQLSELAT
ncbi:LysR family transcriptional regulator [Vibrio sp. SCSIO 43136]|uniref:LysR family transcriptional regulator n=1 Tax=Vibrio sp. SCSIO 43136 TaxID=2819101 RepID=UPI00207597B6|nr:LysR family transcriptional regulator [Vibrio sp. SCSIO 43136]USD65897.1 LysR family transcriptional regulator [Vibrio sp. SCSIO 43136]